MAGSSAWRIGRRAAAVCLPVLLLGSSLTGASGDAPRTDPTDDRLAASPSTPSASIVAVEDLPTPGPPVPTPDVTVVPTPSSVPSAVPAASCPAQLQPLVDATPAGGTLTVGACRFAETVSITKPLRLIGVGAQIDGEHSRKYGIVVKADDVTVEGFEVLNTANPQQEGAIHVRGSQRFVLRNSSIHHAAGACISIGDGGGHQVVDSELAYCGQEGFHLTNLSDSILARNRIHHNNPEGAFDMEWEAGGGKATRSTRLVFEANEVYANGGPGLWCDIDCRDVTYRANWVHHNAWAGIFFEISDGAVIVDNVAWENGWGKTTWGWGAGILLAGSRNVEVYGNTVAWNADGISVISQDRSGSYAYQPGVSTWNSVVNVYVHANDIIVAPQPSDGTDKFLLAWLQDWNGGVMFDPASNNRGYGNRYWHAQPEPSPRFAWAGGKSRLDDFRATPGDPAGGYLTTAERDALLAARGLPLGGEAH